MNDSISLYELNNRVRHAINDGLSEEYWVQAELSDVRENSSGHCFLELVQKDERSNALVAKARGTVWATTYRLLKPYFEESTGQSFVSGIKVLVKVVVDFHELYGYSLTVVDIDPSYTLGDMAVRRREILKRLEEEGILTLNKELDFTPLVQRIAVISSPTAAGYGDFCHQLLQNPQGYAFYVELFPAVMQGTQVETSVVSALYSIHERFDDFDAVVIIRGGGATSDLSDFDTYMLAAVCAQYPLPIIVGIGHERDETVLDYVAHTSVKTPTAAAEFLINLMDENAQYLYDLAERINQSVKDRLEKEKTLLNQYSMRIPLLVNHYIQHAKMELLSLDKDLSQAVRLSVNKEKNKLHLYSQRVKDASPETILGRGYSMTLKNGKAIKHLSDVKDGDELTTRLIDGEVKSVVSEK